MTEREALKLALEVLERCGSENYTIEREASTAIKEALAQPEPVAFDVKCDACEGNGLDWDDNNYKCVACSGLGFVQKLLYNTPPQRTWVGLTDDDLRQIILVAIGVAEAKLKEKNT